MDSQERLERVIRLVDILESFAAEDQDPDAAANQFAAVAGLLESGTTFADVAPELLGLATVLCRWWTRDTGRPSEELFSGLRQFFAGEPSEEDR